MLNFESCLVYIKICKIFVDYGGEIVSVGVKSKDLCVSLSRFLRADAKYY